MEWNEIPGTANAKVGDVSFERGREERIALRPVKTCGIHQRTQGEEIR